jgi:NAD(P)-dependent dehydrogenase (short-subunit alcohol dehydrogenase family)
MNDAMLAQGSGSIVNVSSIYGHVGAAGASVYAAGKHAVEGLTKSAALEAAASGVRVNAVDVVLHCGRTAQPDRPDGANIFAVRKG